MSKGLAGHLGEHHFIQKQNGGLNVGRFFRNQLNIYTFQYITPGLWRRRRDSNPRDDSSPTPLAGERLRPLGHVSVDPFSDVGGGVKGELGVYGVGRCACGLGGLGATWALFIKVTGAFCGL